VTPSRLMMQGEELRPAVEIVSQKPVPPFFMGRLSQLHLRCGDALLCATQAQAACRYYSAAIKLGGPDSPSAKTGAQMLLISLLCCGEYSQAIKLVDGLSQHRGMLERGALDAMGLDPHDVLHALQEGGDSEERREAKQKQVKLMLTLAVVENKLEYAERHENDLCQGWYAEQAKGLRRELGRVEKAVHAIN